MQIDSNDVRVFYNILHYLPKGAITEAHTEENGITFYFTDSGGDWYVYIGSDGLIEKRVINKKNWKI